MELITKSIPNLKSEYRIVLEVPRYYLELLDIKVGDKIKLKRNIVGCYLIEKSNDKNGIIMQDGWFHFPLPMMHRFRITSNHKTQFLMNKGRIIFKFNKPKVV